MKATFGEINQEQVSETKIRALRQGFLNGDKSSSTILAHSDETNLLVKLSIAFTLSSTNIDLLTIPIISKYTTFCSDHCNSRPTTFQPLMTWISILHVVVLSLLLNDNRDLVKDFALVCGQSGHLKATCPRSNSRFRPQRQVQAIAMEDSSNEVSGKRSRPTLSRGLGLGREFLPPEILRTDMMNMEDGDGFDSCKGDNSARVFLFLLFLPFENFFFLALSDSGPFRTLILSSWIAAPMIYSWIPKLAADLQIPLLELSTPITLRLADGDSSSSLTHRTVPLQLHIGKHVETATFYVTDLCHGFILGYSWLERHNPRNQLGGLGKPPDISKIFESPLAPDSIPAPTELSPISCSLSDSISLESMQADVYPFVEVSPVSDVSVPPDILSSFSSLFSEDQAETLPPHRDFDCSIDLKPGSEPFHGKIYQLTREEDKVMQEWIQDNLRQGFIRSSSSPHGAPCFLSSRRTNYVSAWTTVV
ncbi:hypothetical protein BASA81_015093 [Batrachochytrium salamandrivorans]|nr:hypothetical protein BASA81_015093 [Batrachochytrium salamandrivorans]